MAGLRCLALPADAAPAANLPAAGREAGCDQWNRACAAGPCDWWSPESVAVAVPAALLAGRGFVAAGSVALLGRHLHRAGGEPTLAGCSRAGCPKAGSGGCRAGHPVEFGLEPDFDQDGSGSTREFPGPGGCRYPPAGGDSRSRC
jgi:hypothetical protein